MIVNISKEFIELIEKLVKNNIKFDMYGNTSTGNVNIKTYINGIEIDICPYYTLDNNGKPVTFGLDAMIGSEFYQTSDVEEIFNMIMKL